MRATMLQAGVIRSTVLTWGLKENNMKRKSKAHEEEADRRKWIEALGGTVPKVLYVIERFTCYVFCFPLVGETDTRWLVPNGRSFRKNSTRNEYFTDGQAARTRLRQLCQELISEGEETMREAELESEGK
jgi:hypothetical protein